MTGIERLRQMAEDFKNVKAAERCTFIVNTWRGRYIDDAIDDIADQIEREADVETVRSDAMMAWEWVREHGGIEGLSRLFQDADSRRVELCAALGIDLDKGWSEAMAAMRLRLMPEGCEWPRYESGEPVQFGDDVSRHGEDSEANVITLYRDGSFSLNFWAYEKGERVERPAVLAADGEPLEVGQTVWLTDGRGPWEVSRIVNADRWRVIADDEENGHLNVYPENLTHQRPVLDADGVPINVGDTVYEVGENYPPFVVGRLPEPGAYRSVRVVYPSGAFTGLDPERLTHVKPEPPDSWERIEEDAENVAKLFDSFDADASEDIREIVCRCKALAERERGK